MSALKGAALGGRGGLIGEKIPDLFLWKCAGIVQLGDGPGTARSRAERVLNVLCVAREHSVILHKGQGVVDYPASMTMPVEMGITESLKNGPRSFWNSKMMMMMMMFR